MDGVWAAYRRGACAGRWRGGGSERHIDIDRDTGTGTGIGIGTENETDAVTPVPHLSGADYWGAIRSKTCSIALFVSLTLCL